MRLNFDQLPDNLLENIFKLLHPVELFDLCLLNKCLLTVTKSVIRYNLTYSVYDQFISYKNYQQEFIETNGLSMNHININESTLKHLSSCLNIRSINYESLYDHGNKFPIKAKLPKLKKIVMCFSELTEELVIFNNYLNQVEVFEVFKDEIVIEDFIKHLSSDKLKSLTLYSIYDLNISGLDTIKTKFKNLRVLHLKSLSFITTNGYVNPNISFNSSLNLKIEGYIDFKVSCLGDLKQLNSIELLINNNTVFDNTNKNEERIIESIKCSGYISLGYFEFSSPITHSFSNLPTLKEVYFTEFSKESLNSISLIPSIQVISFSFPYSDLKDLIEEFYCNKYSDYKEKRKLVKCNSVKKINFEDFYPLSDLYLYFLSFFPNIKTIKTDHLDALDDNEMLKATYKFTSPLLLIAPINPYLPVAFYDELAKKPMLSWMKLDPYY
ncbi:hypothetical protein K502DRAFT_357659 [Neoconidiobolus thromboides FSU 785]|nr:hypothetical protein K502DRAFT_357659 [Neoconidiobolus thromboides FSU 785]